MGIFFGKGNPNNWNVKDFDTLVKAHKDVTVESLVRSAFSLFARFHAKFWCDRKLLKNHWLRGAKWMIGQERKSWQSAIDLAVNAWDNLKKDMSASSELVWKKHPHLVACLNASVKKTSWDAFQLDCKRRSERWTLVQGDCHPGNVLVNKEGKSRLIDFEMVGLGSGAQDLGQFMISHTTPKERREIEKGAIKVYQKELCEWLQKRGISIDGYDFDACWAEYINGGAGRWLWFVPYLAQVCPPAVANFFIAQTDAFLRDHIPDPLKSPAMRV